MRFLGLENVCNIGHRSVSPTYKLAPNNSKYTLTTLNTKFIMKLQQVIFTGLGCLAALTFGGCKANVDLKNIDTKTQMDLGVALPIGSMSATIGDFFGDGQVDNIYIDSIDNKGVLTFKDTFHIERKYHQVDLSQYISAKTLSMNVYEKLDGTPVMDDHKITGNDNVPITLEFPFSLKLTGINQDEANERLDSALIEHAMFTSTVNTKDLPLEWEWINSITLELGNEFSRNEGKMVEVYHKGEGYGYGQDIPINISEFSLNLMKNRTPSSWEGYYKNVIDSCNFVIHFNFTVPTSAGQITIPENAAFRYDLMVQFIDYKAIWGMFKSSKDMHDEDTVTIADEWDKWRSIKRANIPFAEPTIDVNITTKIAGALMMQGDYLFTADSTMSQVHYASFDGQKTYYRTFHKGEYLPLSSQIGDSATMTIRFDKDPSRGKIDELVSIRPDKLGYKYAIDFNRQSEPQIRITPNTGVSVDAIATLPFIFNEGLALTYADTLKDVDLSAYTIDSLLSSIDKIVVDTVRTSDLKLLIKFSNTIPLRIKATLRALDENDHIIMDPTDPSKPYQITTLDTITIEAPKVEYIGGQFITSASETTDIISVSKAQIDVFDKIKSIQYEASIDNEALQDAYKLGNYKVRITEDNKLVLKIGLSAMVDATFDFEKDENK